MFKIKLNKRDIKKHDGTMTVDVTFTNGIESFTKVYQFPISYGLQDIKKEAKAFIEDYEEAIALILDPTEEIDITVVDAERTPERVYREKKRQLERYMEMVKLGVFDTNDAEIVALRAEVKNKFKPKYK